MSFYRWKGENVATQDITEILRDVSFIQDVVVYGVEVKGELFLFFTLE